MTYRPNLQVLLSATTTRLGGVKPDGATLSTTNDGTMSVLALAPGMLPAATLDGTHTVVVYASDGTEQRTTESGLAQWTATLLNKRQSIAYAATVTPDLSQGRNVEIGQLTGNITVANPTNPPEDGGTITLRFAQDTAGGRTVTWGSKFKGGSKTLSTAAGAVDRAVFQYRLASDTYEGAVTQNVGA